MPVKTRLPYWLKVKLPHGENYRRIRSLLSQGNLNTVCEEARCPNVGECWGGGTATFMVMGDTCTRGCRFCAVQTAKLPFPVDPQEPCRLAQSVHALELDYVVITSVCRDDLSDHGAEHFAKCITAVKEKNPEIIVEVLIPDFGGNEDLLKIIVDANPEVAGHNVETVERLCPVVRDPRASYRMSLRVLEQLKEIKPALYTKSSLMLGLGETEKEIVQTMLDLRRAGVDFLTLGQYLRPTSLGRNLRVAEYIPPEKFEHLRASGKAMGFLYVASGPFVRTSYRAGEFFVKSVVRSQIESFS